jgi:Bifunctional DNA primase/polymerase, N-terminal
MTDSALRANESKRPGSNVDAALDHARRGFHVFPIADGTKDRPLVRWSREATTDEAKIRGWWRTWPTANIGVATGPSGLLVVDVDNKNRKDGDRSLDGLELMWGDLPETLTARRRPADGTSISAARPGTPSASSGLASTCAQPAATSSRRAPGWTAAASIGGRRMRPWPRRPGGWSRLHPSGVGPITRPRPEREMFPQPTLG